MRSDWCGDGLGGTTAVAKRSSRMAHFRSLTLNVRNYDLWAGILWNRCPLSFFIVVADDESALRLAGRLPNQRCA